MKFVNLKFRFLKNKKGFTLIELIISISLLGIILAATMSIFVTALKNYQVNFQKSAMQKEINFSLDSITNDIRNGATIMTSYGDYSSSENTIIIGTPAKDENDNFIYTGDEMQLDYIVYYQSGTEIRKHIYANALGEKYEQHNSDHEILNNLSSLNFEYIPSISTATQIKTTIDLSKQINKSNVGINESKTVNLRNTND